mmetsp:Transcript_18570/g.21342  ORF Transcript_18570/g.21342 Transcript_18570/m.21342 type:complete len:171 (-) Transcript_18570:132-644(-)
MMNLRMINLCLLVLTCLVFNAAKAEDYDCDPNVKIFREKESFERSVLQSNSIWFVQFCEKGNKNCKEYVPIFSRAAEITKGFYNFALVDMSSKGGQAIGEDYFTATLPVHYIFSPTSQPSKYYGELDLSKILQTLMNETVRTIQDRNKGKPDNKKEKEKKKEKGGMFAIH